mmetsp:Transcript_24208/g.52209  ORF Transcript_24208/g.52209 Transcript_24208/m.52209 type:complete len:309 (-) Transcript_24208:143-1069(-)|eukprot:CAMPEP_0172310312 /NCGR_PEP_ID=MMETSP1058-20130122/11415_1 /TAXON_ID=83371 /ORGANISM="Detonula confervacea, Strain CCMP 353" /LENGTH=308 /DNA_ID=CAMNT_0013023105 /DNA_START=71 /DNA_END=997 /DNA_ORIENTATION=+
MKSVLLVVVAAIVSSCSAFSIQPSARTAVSTRSNIATPAVRDLSRRLHNGDADYEEALQPRRHLNRRSALSIFTLLPLSIITSSSPLPAKAESGKGKVVVLGGAGWVGAHVSANLNQQGYQVVSISRSTAEVQTKRTKSILGTAIPGVEYVSLDAGSASIEDLASPMKDTLAVISCVGIAPGSPNQKDGNGLVNSRIAKAAKLAGVPKFVYIGVASSLANGPAKFLLGDYFKGKAEAEKSVAQEFGEKSLIVKPAIVAGGTPGEIRPPGPPGMKPVDVEAVAKAVVAGALGELKGEIDGNDAIVAIAS